jgi:SAM-dependent methyltransferase
MNFDDILLRLGALSRHNPEFSLLQFRTLVSARQYILLYKLIEKHVPKGSAVLDWGCGNGHVSYALDALSYKTTGFSLDGAPGLATHLPSCTFISGSESEPEKLPFPESSFDAVLSVGVLEHVRETGGSEVGSMKEIRRVLKPSGAFICYHLPNQYSYVEAVSRLIPTAHHHRYRFIRKDIDKLCTASGFNIIDIDRYGSLVRNPWQLAPPRLGNSQIVADAWDTLDNLGKWLLPGVVQNYCFVATPITHP